MGRVVIIIIENSLRKERPSPYRCCVESWAPFSSSSRPRSSTQIERCFVLQSIRRPRLDTIHREKEESWGAYDVSEDVGDTEKLCESRGRHSWNQKQILMVCSILAPLGGWLWCGHRQRDAGAFGHQSILWYLNFPCAMGSHMIAAASVVLASGGQVSEYLTAEGCRANTPRASIVTGGTLRSRIQFSCLRENAGLRVLFSQAL